MGFLNTNSMPRLVEKLSDGDNIKITGNSKGSRVGTVIKKIVEKADDVTKAVEQEVVNNSYSFKVGTGNVDVSTDVQDGFGEVGVKGVTYQNILSKDSKNARQFIQKDLNARVKGLNSNLIKSSTKYTLVFDVTQINLAGLDSIGLYIQGSITDSSMVKVASVSTVGIYKYVFTSSSKAITNNYFDLKGHASQWENDSTTTSRTLTLANVMLIEGEIDQPTSYFEDIVGVGDKSKNLFNPNNSAFVEKQGDKYVATVSNASLNYDTLSLKPNTKYTVSAKFEKWLQLNIDGVVIASGSAINGVKWTFTTNNTGVTKFYFGANSPSDIGYSFIEPIQLEEGSTVTPYEPYYDGHKIEILSHGKNLFDVNNTQRYNFNATSLAINAANEDTRSFTFKIKANTTYCLSGATNIFTLTNSNCARVLFTNEFPKEGIVATRLPNLNNNVSTIRHDLSGYVTLVFLKNSGNWDYFTWFDNASSIQIEEGAIATNYEPYQEDKTQILLDEPLMRLPNGTHDEITRDGKLIRRVGKIVFDGTENWSPYNINGNTTHFAISIPYIDKFNGGLISHIEHNNNKFMCDKALVTQTRKENLTSICSFYYGPENRYFMFNLPCSSLESAKNWLIENKPILYFLLPTPTITELPAPYLRIFKDGHLTFNTLVAPESNHVVQLNKSAQIERSIREVQSLDSRVGKLESFYDDMMLETNHKLSLLNYDFEYTRERNGE